MYVATVSLQLALNCIIGSNGTVEYTNLGAGSHVLRVMAKTADEEKSVLRRKFFTG